MSKSRGRGSRKGRGAHRPTGRPNALRAAQQPGRDELLERWPVIRAVEDAELRGDALGALELIESDIERHGGALGDNFWRPQRIRRLMQIQLFGPAMPGWAVSRWLLEQSAQWLDPRGGERMRKAIDVAVRTRGDRSGRCASDPDDARCKVMDHDWICRQVNLYELGGLRGFLARAAPADLVAGADRIREWAGSPMGGHRLVTATPGTVTWADLTTGEEVWTDNLGAAVLLEDGDCVLGRMVPIEGGRMFESSPLFVPEHVAQRVASEPADWLQHLAEGCREPQEEDREILTDVGHDFGILTDLPLSVLQIVALQVGQRAGISLDDSPGRLAASLVLAAVRHGIDPAARARGDVDPWPAVGAALLEPSALVSLADELNEQDVPSLHDLARLLPSPGPQLCLGMADELRMSA